MQNPNSSPLEVSKIVPQLTNSEIADKVRVVRGAKSDDLRGRLMLVFAAGAILPMIIAVFAMTSIAERGIVTSTDELANISREVLTNTSTKLGGESKRQIAATGKQLTDMGSKAVQDTAGTLVDATEKRMGEANKQLIAQGEASNKAVTDKLVKQGQDATQALGKELITVSSESNRELANTTAKLAGTAIAGLSDNLVATSSRNTSAISQYIVAQNTESAKQLSERMLTDIEREPVVNFKTLASIFAQGIATNKVTPIRDGYLAVVDARGRVLASTRYKKGTNIKNLAIVQQAVEGKTPEDSLLRFKEGNDEYLGVFARRDDGGAVVFAYLADRARVDTDRMKGDIQRTLNTMGSSSSRYVIQRLEADKAVIRGQAERLSKEAIAKLAATNQALSARTAERMQAQADKISKTSVDRMSAQSKEVAAASTAAMKSRSETIAKAAIAEMRPLGQSNAAKAEQAMRSEANKFLQNTDAIDRAAKEASAQAAERMAPAARQLADKAKGQMWLVALLLIGIEVVLAVLASLLMSGRIANPILQQQQKSREEKERLGREMEIASKIQTCLLPPAPDLTDFDVAVTMVPAEEVGGDFVDLVPDREPGGFWIGIGDVTGHGLTPGLIMMMAQSTFNALAQSVNMTPKKLYDGMNHVLYQNIKDRLGTTDHMTMSILKHERDGSFMHCGSHLDILIFRAETGEVERIVTDGPWIGMLPDSTPFTTENRFSLGDDDVLLLYTDGLIEVQDVHSEQWDMDRLCDALARHAHLDAKDIQAGILTESLKWANKILDDISMIVIKRSCMELEGPDAEGRYISVASRARVRLPAVKPAEV